MTDVYNFIENKDILKIEETPKTGSKNYYIYIKPTIKNNCL